MPRPVTQTRSAEQRRQELERERLRIQAEIVSYPMPIPACDAFFNDLLERRSRVCDELRQLDRTPSSHDTA